MRWCARSIVVLALACGSAHDPSPAPVASASADGSTSVAGASDSGAADSGAADSGAADSGAAESSSGPCPADGCGPCERGPCEDVGDPLRAMGLTCPDRELGDAAVSSDDAAIAIIEYVGQGDTYAPTEGSSMVVLGTGRAVDLRGAAMCNGALGPSTDVGTLPDPIAIDGVDSVHDYGEIRVATTVPTHAAALAFDFAFLSSEYPERQAAAAHDMFVVWLESEDWTGTIAFDGAGTPISIAAEFVDRRDDADELPQFVGTCIAGHAGTDWLTTTADVRAGENIGVIFAIFDAGDTALDSFVLLDGFRWECEGVEGEPFTRRR